MSRRARLSRAAAFAAGLAAAAALAACDRPPDEAWLRITAIEDSSGTPLATLETWLEEESTESVLLRLENRTSTAGLEGGGTGILVGRLRVEAAAGGRSFPAREQPVTLYLPPGDGDGQGGTALAVDIVTPALKRWVLDNVHVPDEGLEGAARITVHAVTDEGRELRTSGGLGLRVVNGPRPPAP